MTDVGILWCNSYRRHVLMKRKTKNTTLSEKLQKYDSKNLGRGKIDVPQIDYRSFSWLDIGTSIKSGRIKLVLWAQSYPLSEIMRSWKCFPHVSKMPTLTYNVYRASGGIIKNSIILNIIHNIFILRDTEVVRCIL